MSANKLIESAKLHISSSLDPSSDIKLISEKLIECISEKGFYELPLNIIINCIKLFKYDLTISQINAIDDGIRCIHGQRGSRLFRSIRNVSQVLAFVEATVPPGSSDSETPVVEEEENNEGCAEEESLFEEEEGGNEENPFIGDDEVPEGLLRCVWLGDLEGVKDRILNNPEEINCIFDRVGGALHCAVYNDRDEIVDLLLSNGFNPAQRCALGQTPLHIACQGDMENIFLSIVNSKGVDLDSRNDEGETALIISTRRSKAAYVRILIEKGANINIQNRNGETALHIAAKNGYTDISQVLLNANANFSLVDCNHKTPFLLACEHSHGDIASMISRKFSQLNDLIIIEYSSDSD